MKELPNPNSDDDSVISSGDEILNIKVFSEDSKRKVTGKKSNYCEPKHDDGFGSQ